MVEKFSILIVEDDLIIAEMLCEMLLDLGYAVIVRQTFTGKSSPGIVGFLLDRSTNLPFVITTRPLVTAKRFVHNLVLSLLNCEKHLQLICILLFSVNALSQTWAPSGATWHYRADGGYYVFTYSGDTVLSFVNCKVIEKRFIFDNSWGTGIDTLTNYEYMYADTDRVYIYRFNAFQVLYDFSAVVGDTLTVPGTNHYTGCDSTGLVRVDTTGTMVINGQTLRFYSVHHIGTTGWGWNTRIVEKVGPIYNYSVAATAYFLPVKMDYCGMLPDEISEGGPFRCYQDNSFGLFQLSAEACDFITASQEIFAEESRVQVYPNPNEGLFTGDVTSTALYSVYNNFGRLVINGELIAGKNNVMLPAVLSKGVYVLVITDSKSNVVKNKIAVR